MCRRNAASCLGRSRGIGPHRQPPVLADLRASKILRTTKANSVMEGSCTAAQLHDNDDNHWSDGEAEHSLVSVHVRVQWLNLNCMCIRGMRRLCFAVDQTSHVRHSEAQQRRTSICRTNLPPGPAPRGRSTACRAGANTWGSTQLGSADRRGSSPALAPCSPPDKASSCLSVSFGGYC